MFLKNFFPLVLDTGPEGIVFKDNSHSITINVQNPKAINPVDRFFRFLLSISMISPTFGDQLEIGGERI